MSTIVTSGGLGNQFFQSLALSILVEKNNLKVTYNTMNKFRFFDILYEGTLSYDRTTILNESTFFELLESYPIQNNILVQRETFFQNKEISNYYYQYLRKEEIQQRVMKANPYKTRYGCGIRSKAEDNHAYSEGLRRSPEEYGEESIRSYKYHNYPDNQWGVHMYMLSREGAEKIIENYANGYADNPENIFSPDWTISKCPGLKRAIIYPMFAVEDGADLYEHYGHSGQYNFHMDTFKFNYIPDVFI